MTKRLSLDETIDALERGRVVALPTDTVYGVAASIHERTAVAGLFTLKRRPSDVALPIMIDSFAALESLGVTFDERATRLANAFWPGALTIVVPAPARLARLVGASSNAVGFRVPDDETLRAILSIVGPLAVTSANEHGEPPCESAEQVLASFAERGGWAGVYDAGERHGVVSTVVEMGDEQWRVRRTGALSVARIAAILN